MIKKKPIIPPFSMSIMSCLQGQNHYFTILIHSFNESINTIKILYYLVFFNIFFCFIYYQYLFNYIIKLIKLVEPN
jgi:hypothetical protein